MLGSKSVNQGIIVR